MTLTWFALLALAAPQFPAGSPPPAPPDLPFGYDLSLPPGMTLQGFGWDGGAVVPFSTAAPAVRLEYGARGLRALTRAYLPGNDPSEAVASGAGPVSNVNVVADEGRLGRALRFAPDSSLRIGLPAPDPDANGWTLAFWVRPESAGYGRLMARLPGALEVWLQTDGRVRAALLPSGGQLTHPTVLSLGQWTYVLVAYDPGLERQMRLFVGDSAVNLRFFSALPARQPATLELGDLAGNSLGFAGFLDELSFEDEPASTAQAFARANPVVEPGTHQLDLYTNQGLRRLAPAASVTKELVLDTPEDFALGRLKGVVSVGGELRWAPARWREIETDGAPPPRTTHPLVALGGGRVFTFGGETRDTHLWPMVNTDDTWILDATKATWSRISTAVAPSPRCHVPAAYSPDHDLVLYVGGWRNDVSPGQISDETWVFHVGQARWERRSTAGYGGISDQALVYLPTLQRFLMLRGIQNALYDPVTDTWLRLPPAQAFTESGQPTSYAIGASTACALDPSTGLVVTFGGSYGPQSLTFSDTTTLYDVLSNTYTVLAPPVRPSPRVRGGHAFDTRRGNLVYFGGVQDQYSQRHDDLWIFDPRARTWREVDCSDRPSRRGGYYGMAYDEDSDRFILWGGRSAYDRWLDDTWSLELDPQRSGSALYTFDRGGQGPGTWFADTVTPGNSSVRFLFRSSSTGARWSTWQSATGTLGRARYLQVVAVLRPGSNGVIPSIQRMGFR